MKNILFFRVWLEIVYLRRGRSFVGMIILGGCFGYWVLTQRSLLCRDDNFWGGCFGMGDLFLTQGVSFVGMTILGGWLFLEWVLGTYAGVASLLG